jgi:hypothetical protein
MVNQNQPTEDSHVRATSTTDVKYPSPADAAIPVPGLDHARFERQRQAQVAADAAVAAARKASANPNANAPARPQPPPVPAVPGATGKPPAGAAAAAPAKSPVPPVRLAPLKPLQPPTAIKGGVSAIQSDSAKRAAATEAAWQALVHAPPNEEQKQMMALKGEKFEQWKERIRKSKSVTVITVITTPKAFAAHH